MLLKLIMHHLIYLHTASKAKKKKTKKKNVSVKLRLFFTHHFKHVFLGAQKDRLIDKVLLSTTKYVFVEKYEK